MPQDSIVSGGSALLDPVGLLLKLGVYEKMKVADFGCGATGHFIIPAAKMTGNVGTVYAMDIQKPILKAMENLAQREGVDNIIKTVWTNLEIYGATKSIKDNYLDLGLLVNTLFQTKKYKAIMTECSRMIRKRGKLLVVDWLPIEATFGPKKENKVDKEQIKKIAAEIGLSLIDEFVAGPYHFGLIFRKL